MRKFLNQLIHTYLMCLSEGRVLHVRVIADISARSMLCCSILNPKCLLRFHIFHTCVVNWMNHSSPNIIAVILHRVTRTFWWYSFSMRMLPTSQTCASRTLLHTMLPNNILCCGWAIVMTSTSWTRVSVITKRNLAISGHDVGVRVMRNCGIFMQRGQVMQISRKYFGIPMQRGQLMDISRKYCRMLMQGGCVVLLLGKYCRILMQRGRVIEISS